MVLPIGALEMSFSYSGRIFFTISLACLRVRPILVAACAASAAMRPSMPVARSGMRLRATAEGGTPPRKPPR